MLPRRLRHRAWLALAAALVAALAVSPFAGRADIDGGYRPLLTGDGITEGCYPLPGGVELPFPYVLRHDGEVLGAHGLRRQVVVHYDVVDGATALARAEEAFAAAGVGDDVQIAVADFPGVGDDAIVRGQMLLDLPVQPLIATATNAEACADPYVTKRFPAEREDVS